MATWLDFLALADRALPKYRKAFLDAVAAAQRGVDVKALEAALKARNYSAAGTLIENAWASAAPGWEKDLTKHALDLLGDAGSMESAGLYVSSVVTPATTKLGLPTFKFDLVNPRAVDWARNQSSTLIKNITADQRQSIRTIIAQATKGDYAVGKATRLIRDLPLGLDSPRAAALAKFEERMSAKLVAMSAKGASAAAMAKATAKTDAAVARYRQKLVTARAQTIARTETMSAANQGRMEAWQQAMDAGKLPKTAKKIWITTPDDRRCTEVCKPVHKQVRDMKIPFTVPKKGSMQRPPAHPNCRCTVQLASGKTKVTPEGVFFGSGHAHGSTIAIPEVAPLTAGEPFTVKASFRARSSAWREWKKTPGSQLVRNKETGMFEIRIPTGGTSLTSTTTVVDVAKTSIEIPKIVDTSYTVLAEKDARSSAWRIWKKNPGSKLVKNTTTGKWEVRIVPGTSTTTTTTTVVKMPKPKVVAKIAEDWKAPLQTFTSEGDALNFRAAHFSKTGKTVFVEQTGPGEWTAYEVRGTLMGNANTEGLANALIDDLRKVDPSKTYIARFDPTPGIKKPWKVYWDDASKLTTSTGPTSTTPMVKRVETLAHVATEESAKAKVAIFEKMYPEQKFFVKYDPAYSTDRPWAIVREKMVPDTKVLKTIKGAENVDHQIIVNHPLADAMREGGVVVVKKGAFSDPLAVMGFRKASIATMTSETDLLAALDDYGVTFVFSDGSVADVLPRLKGVRPRGWPAGKTWDDVRACYSTSEKYIIDGVGEGCSIGTVVGHETGHALDHLSRDAAKKYGSTHKAINKRLANIWKDDVVNRPISSYLKQEIAEVKAGKVVASKAAGLSETIAESFSEYFSRGIKGVENVFGKAWADEFEKCVESIRELGRAAAKKTAKVAAAPTSTAATMITAPPLSEYTVAFEHASRSSAWRVWKKTPGSELTLNKTTMKWEVRVPTALVTTGESEVTARYVVRAFAEKARDRMLSAYPEKIWSVEVDAATGDFLVVARTTPATTAAAETLVEIPKDFDALTSYIEDRADSLVDARYLMKEAERDYPGKFFRIEKVGDEYRVMGFEKTLVAETPGLDVATRIIEDRSTSRLAAEGTRDMLARAHPTKLYTLETDASGDFLVVSYKKPVTTADDVLDTLMGDAGKTAAKTTATDTTAREVTTHVGDVVDRKDIAEAMKSGDISVMRYPSGDGEAFYDWEKGKWVTDASGKVLIVEDAGAGKWKIAARVEPKSGLATGHVKLPARIEIEVAKAPAGVDVTTRFVEDTFTSDALRDAERTRDAIARVASSDKTVVVEKVGDEYHVVSYTKAKTPETLELPKTTKDIADFDLTTKAVEDAFPREAEALKLRDDLMTGDPDRFFSVEWDDDDGWRVVSFEKKKTGVVDDLTDVDLTSRRVADKGFLSKADADDKAALMRRRKATLGSDKIVRVEYDASRGAYDVVVYEKKSAATTLTSTSTLTTTSTASDYTVVGTYRARSSATHAMRRTPGSTIVRDKATGMFEVRVAKDGTSLARTAAERGVTKAPKVVAEKIPADIVLDVERSPEWFDDLLKKQVGSQGGSNKGGLFETSSGEKWYVKFYDDVEQGRGEHLANALYRQLGFNAPESVIGLDSQGRAIYASRWMEGAQEVGRLGLTKERADKILDSFLADVLTANWDAVGSGLNNVVELADGRLARIDSGGTFFFRAKAGRKDLALLDKITEWENFIDRNPDYASVFHTAGFDSADALGQRLVKQLKVLEAKLDPKSDKLHKLLQQVFAGIKDERTRNQAIGRYGMVIEKRLSLISERVKSIEESLLADSARTATRVTQVSGGEVDRLAGAETERIVRERTSRRMEAAERYIRRNVPDEAKRKTYQKNLEDVVARSSIVRNIEERDLRKVLEGGRFKTQFETNTTGGCLNPRYRSKEEHAMFNIPDDVHWNYRERPIYGTLQTDPEGTMFTARQYGDCRVRFKNGVKNRTTALSSDSLGATSEEFAPAWVNKPTLRMVDSYKMKDLASRVNDINDIASGYFEIQIHGGVSIEDIAEIYFLNEPSAWMKTKLAQLGIPWKKVAGGSRRW